MSLHIELRGDGKASVFVPRTATLIPLSKHGCVLVANGLGICAYGVTAAQMNDAINGGLFVVDCLHVVVTTVEASWKETWQTQHANAAAAMVARANAKAAGVPNPVLTALETLIQRKMRG